MLESRTISLSHYRLLKKQGSTSTENELEMMRDFKKAYIGVVRTYNKFSICLTTRMVDYFAVEFVTEKLTGTPRDPSKLRYYSDNSGITLTVQGTACVNAKWRDICDYMTTMVVDYEALIYNDSQLPVTQEEYDCLLYCFKFVMAITQQKTFVHFGNNKFPNYDTETE
jgi:hypothetical protein